jgi:hypothetical protein
MIVYDLQCVNGHRFEGWFEDENAYKEQDRNDLIACPLCNVSAVSRIPSTFGIKSAAPVPANSPPVPTDSELAEFGRQMTEFIEKNFDNVGCDFTKEALKIHYGVEEPRNIRGTSTPDEEKVLKEEGIDFIKIPIPSNSESDA